MTRGLAVLVALAACAPADDARPPTLVFAAASLTAAFEGLAEAWQARRPDARVELNFAGTSSLVLQLREGAPADLLASADEPNMQRVVELGLVRDAPRVFAGNALVIVTPPGNPRGIGGLADLARHDLAVLLCAPEVPAGRYAREALAAAGVSVRPVSDEPSVKAVVAKLQLGEADAGVVYTTDAAAAGDSLHAVPIPPEHNVSARYPLAVLRAGRDPDGAAAFADFVLSPAGRAILAAHGFAAP